MIEVVTQPAVEPVDLEEFKSHARIFGDDQDGLCELYIQSAREWCEVYCRRAFVNQTLRERFDNWPAGREFKLSRGPVRSITSVTYLDADGATQTLSSALYAVDPDAFMQRFWLDEGENWPTIDSIENAVTVTYVAGYGADASDVPAKLRQALLMLASHFNLNRDATTPGDARFTIEQIPLGVKSLLSMHRAYEFK